MEPLATDDTIEGIDAELNELLSANTKRLSQLQQEVK
jgi:hypothetical protein